MLKLDLQHFGGRGAGSGGGGIPELNPIPGGGGGGGNNPLDQNPGSPDTLKEALGEKGRPMSVNNAIMKANPFYDGSYGEYSENCQRAVVATEGRFRGYDVIAQPTYEGDTAPRGDNWKGFFKNAKTDNVGRTTPNATQKALESKMKEYGDGSRAIMRVQWKGRGASGHVLNVVQKNGKTYYYDGQVGGKYNTKSLYNAIRTGDTQLVRVDNLSFSDKAKEAVRKTPKGMK